MRVMFLIGLFRSPLNTGWFGGRQGFRELLHPTGNVPGIFSPPTPLVPEADLSGAGFGAGAPVVTIVSLPKGRHSAVVPTGMPPIPVLKNSILYNMPFTVTSWFFCQFKYTKQLV